jgi:hypothetical protein
VLAIREKKIARMEGAISQPCNQPIEGLIIVNVRANQQPLFLRTPRLYMQDTVRKGLPIEKTLGTYLKLTNVLLAHLTLL